MRFNPHLHFAGECEAAFRFYERVLGGKKLEIMKYRDSPIADQFPAELRDKVIHATLEFGEQVLTGADVAQKGYQKPQGFSVLLQVADTEDAERVFKEFAGNGTVQMPLQKTFWTERFGMVTDEFGTPWMVNCGR
jgi:PhnB protein